MDSIVTCSNCGARNRLRKPPDGQLPACGKCGSSLPWLVHASDRSFGEELEAPLPVLVDFWAPWCGPCHMIAPVLEQVATDHRGRIKIVKLDIDENPVTAGRYRVMSIPTMILFREGEPRETIVGAVSKQALLQRLSPHL